MVSQYSDDNFELLIVFVETEQFGRTPNQADCEALQATEDGTVVIDPTHALRDAYDMAVNMGAGLIDGEAHWLSAPNHEQDSYFEATTALRDALGGGWGF